MRKNFDKIFVGFIVGISLLSISLVIAAVFFSDLFEGEGFSYSKGATFATMLGGLVGITISILSVFMYYAALKQGQDQNYEASFQSNLSNSLNNLSNTVPLIAFDFTFYDEYKADPNRLKDLSQEQLKGFGIQAIENAYNIFKRFIMENGAYAPPSTEFLPKVSQHITMNFNQVFMQYILSVDFMLRMIYEYHGQDKNRKEIYYNMVKANINPACYPILLYYYHNKIRSPIRKDSVFYKKLLSKEESFLFEFIDINDLMYKTHLEMFYKDMSA